MNIPSVSSIISKLPSGAREAFTMATQCARTVDGGSTPFFLNRWVENVEYRFQIIARHGGPTKYIDGVKHIALGKDLNGVWGGWRPIKIVYSELIEETLRPGVHTWFKQHLKWVPPEHVSAYWAAAKEWVNPQVDAFLERYPEHFPHIAEQVRLSIWKG